MNGEMPLLQQVLSIKFTWLKQVLTAKLVQRISSMQLTVIPFQVIGRKVMIFSMKTYC